MGERTLFARKQILVASSNQNQKAVKMEELKKEMMAVIAKYNGIRKAGRWIFPAAVAGAAMCELSEIMDKIINHG